MIIHGKTVTIGGAGGGLLDAFCTALKNKLNIHFEIEYYNEHSLEYGTTSRAITYVQIKDGEKRDYFGAGVSSSISKSSIKAVVSAVNRMIG